MRYLINEFWDSITLLGTPVFYIFIVLILSQLNLSLNPIIIFAEFLFLEILCFLLKIIIPKKRPDNSLKKTIANTYEERSFPSIHTARVSFLMFILFTLMPKFVFFFICIIILVGYSRIYFRKHDFTDITGGIFLGVFFGIIWKVI
jgi:membrane-associated phospholipid phosphatase